LFVKKRTKT